MRAILSLALSLSCAACATPTYAPPPGAVAVPQSAALVSSAQAQQNCRSYTTPVLVGGKNETAAGVACEQADGSWRITDNTPGLPPQVYTMPPPGTPTPGTGAPGMGAPDAAQLAAGTTPQGQPECREYTVPITVGAVEKQGVGESCRQPDGSWRIVQDTPGLPQQVYLVPPLPYPLPDYAYDPWYYGPPFALGGSFIFFDGFHRFHHFDHFHHGGFHGHSMGHSWGGGGGHH